MICRSPVVDWPVPQPSKLKYTQIFNQVDKNKTGFLTGMQARQLLVQTGLNQTILAKVWYEFVVLRLVVCLFVLEIFVNFKIFSFKLFGT
jgi:hypothetical protein